MASPPKPYNQNSQRICLYTSHTCHLAPLQVFFYYWRTTLRIPKYLIEISEVLKVAELCVCLMKLQPGDGKLDIQLEIAVAFAVRICILFRASIDYLSYFP